MPSLARLAFALTHPASTKFAALVEAKRCDEAAALALAKIRANRRRAFFLKRLIELRALIGDHAGVLQLFADHAGDPALAVYPMQLARATALLGNGDHEAARPLLLRLIGDQPFTAALQLYRRLPTVPGHIDMAVAAFGRSLRPLVVKTAQATHLVDIATAIGDFDRAHELMMGILRGVEMATFKAEPKPKTPMDPLAGDAALGDLHDLLMPATPFFLISGTLLGVVREGRLLGHDKDIDVGVMGDATRDAIRTAIAWSAQFKEAFEPSADLLKIVHRNGVRIDVFFHHVEDDVVWHGSHLHAWDNRVWWREGEPRFRTERFLNRDFLVPSDPDAYLTDNYGDWRTPVSGYDASLEAPNRRIRDRPLVRLHWQKLIVRYYVDGEPTLLTKAFHHYQIEFGADDYLRAAARQLLMRDIDAEPAEQTGRGEARALGARR